MLFLLPREVSTSELSPFVDYCCLLVTRNQFKSITEILARYYCFTHCSPMQSPLQCCVLHVGMNSTPFESLRVVTHGYSYQGGKHLKGHLIDDFITNFKSTDWFVAETQKLWRRAYGQEWKFVSLLESPGEQEKKSARDKHELTDADEK